VQVGIGGREFFFAESAREIETLAHAYPHLDGRLRERAEEYASMRFGDVFYSSGQPLAQGERRELYDVPKANLKPLETGVRPRIGDLHAFWLYLDRTGQRVRVEGDWHELVAIAQEYLENPMKDLSLPKNQVHLNRTLAGCVAFLRLAEHFALPEDKKWIELAEKECKRLSEAILAEYRAKGKLAAELLAQSTSGGDTSENQGRKLYVHTGNHRSKIALFLDLTPELARELRSAAPAETESLRDFIHMIMPTDYLAFEERNAHYGENFVDLPDTVHGLFLADEWLWSGGKNTLERSDIPWCKADLYHIHKLVTALERE
jgi:hypothetical protein